MDNLENHEHLQIPHANNENNENPKIEFENYKKVMKIIEFHTRITKIIKKIEFHATINENHENHRIPYENNENHENLEFHVRIKKIIEII